jgi:hypothetical protein
LFWLYLSAESGSIVKFNSPNFINLLIVYGSLLSKISLLNIFAKSMGNFWTTADLRDSIDLFFNVFMLSVSS